MESKGLQIFIDALLECAYRFASDYLEEHRLDADTEALRSTLNALLESSFETAISATKERLVNCLVEIADGVFVDAMQRSGTEAAKKVGRPRLKIVSSNGSRISPKAPRPRKPS